MLQPASAPAPAATECGVLACYVGIFLSKELGFIFTAAEKSRFALLSLFLSFVVIFFFFSLLIHRFIVRNDAK